MLDLKTARRLVRQAVEEKPADFVYSTSGGANCFYVPLTKVLQWIDEGEYGYSVESLRPTTNITKDPRYDTPCLIGRVLDLAGETRHHAVRFAGSSVTGLVSAVPDMMDSETSWYLKTIQAAQDRGSTWRAAAENGEMSLTPEQKVRTGEVLVNEQ